ncbi:hypothetical protein AURDEDRAFT_115805 [Auricularia subglabra TFB-10046 SS5]|nr:hypothetical protein AURDEDRAFT_115805 [Auricularia subglabra TFB-10046 SS5]
MNASEVDSLGSLLALAACHPQPVLAAIALGSAAEVATRLFSAVCHTSEDLVIPEYHSPALYHLGG